MLYIKEIGHISENIVHSNFKIKKGKYYYIPEFQDTRIYRHDPTETKEKKHLDKSGYGDFELLC